MVWIEPGALVAGTPPERWPRLVDEELPGEQVVLKGFYIDVLPYPNEDGAIPLTNVNFAQAKRLCEEEDKRLCTELEWERACKGPNNYVYEYGDQYRADRCATGVSPGMRPSGLLVGCKSDFGVRDLHGGAWEWTASFWNRGGNTNLMTTRGGNAPEGELVGRCANASARPQETVAGNVGFRCCAGPENALQVSLEVSRAPRLLAERLVDKKLLAHFIRAVPPQAPSALQGIDHFEALQMWRWHPAGNDELTLFGGCTTSKLPRCGILFGRETRSEFLGWAASGIRLPTLHTAKSTTDLWLLGGDANGPFSRHVRYQWGRLIIFERELPGKASKRSR
ncbi:MAG: SUMF1/EgtB/PvdO family nonheme iron enzyme [Polyangiaceae bacterium]|nr:SUMF1/EgtB/PvdO family nonheme iron enzyme [Polyangiaceae bacterium]